MAGFYTSAATMENSAEVPQALNTELPCDPAIPLWGIYPEQTKTLTQKGSPMFTAALFTRAEIWKQPKRPLTDERMNKTWYVHTYNGISAI